MPRSTDAYLPALPPDLIQAREQKLKKGARPQQGPSRPTEEILPSPHQEREEEKEEEEEGDYIGPAPAPASLDTEALEREQRIQEIESRIKPTTSKKETGEALTRPEWMTQPPPASRSLKQALGEGPLRPRGFSTRPSMPAADLDQTEWTETPEEKRARLLSGRKPRDPGARETQEEVFEAKRAHRYDREAERAVRSNDQSTGRVKSMLEEHQDRMREERRQKRRERKEEEKRVKEEGRGRSSASSRDDYVPWDRERDIARLDPKRQRDALGKMQQLGGRFGHSKRGKFM